MPPMRPQPAGRRQRVCLQWLQRELELVAPQLVIALGASASRALFGRAMPIEKNRGKLTDFAPYGRIMITVHPSFLLRVPDESRAGEYERFVADLRLAARALKRAAD